MIIKEGISNSINYELQDSRERERNKENEGIISNRKENSKGKDAPTRERCFYKGNMSEANSFFWNKTGQKRRIVDKLVYLYVQVVCIERRDSHY